MLIKMKSLVVALISSFLISLALILTLIGYLAYMEFKSEEFNSHYRDQMQKINARVYSKHIEINKLQAVIGTTGALKGKPIMEGVVKNKGVKKITDLLIKVKFVDKDGAVIYESTFRPQEPAFGSANIPLVSIPYLYDKAKVILKPGEDLPFKRILADCPKEIASSLTGSFAKTSGRWSGSLAYEIISLSF